MPDSFTSEDSSRTYSSLSTNHPGSASTAASSRATSPVPIGGQPKRRPSTKRHHTTAGTSSLSPPRAFSPPPRAGSRAGMSPSTGAVLIERMLEEENQTIVDLRREVKRLAGELTTRTDALKQAYERVKAAEHLALEKHNMYLAEREARQRAESETRKAKEKTQRLQVELLKSESERVDATGRIEHLEAEKAQAEASAGRAKAITHELKQRLKINRAREQGYAEGRGNAEWLEEKEEKMRKEELDAAVKAAFEKGKVEGEAAATVKALAAFDRLLDSDELDAWSEPAKLQARQEMEAPSSRSPEVKPAVSQPTESEVSKPKPLAALGRKLSLKRTQS